VIRVYDESGNVIETHEHAGAFKEPQWLLTVGIPLAQLPEEAGAGNHDGSGPKESLS
jgi:hypothetical protein